MAQYLIAPILTVVFPRGTSIRTIFLKSGRKNTRSSGTEAGQEPENVKNAHIIHFVREMVCTIGIKTRKMFWSAIMKN